MLRGGSRRLGVTLIEIIVVLAILLLLLGALVPVMHRLWGQAERMQGQNNLRQIGIAAHNFHDAHGRVPPIAGDAGGTAGSLLYHLLPYIEQDNLYRQGSVWASGTISVRVPVYVDARDPSAPADNKFDNWLATSNYAGSWLVFKNGDRRIANITDGTSNTLMFAERYQVCNGTPCGWGYDGLYYWAPVFGYYSAAKFQTAPKASECNPALAQALQPGGINVAMCDGSVRHAGDRISPETWHHVLTPDGGEVVNPDFEN